MKKKNIFIAGHNGMVGSALVRLLKKQNVKLITKNRKELDLLKQKNVESFFKNKKIDQVYLAAARVGGIYANNTYPAEFIYENLMIQTNIIHASYLNGVKKVLFLGSSCIYPKNTNNPIKEKQLLTGLLEPTNEPYAVAKIAGIKICESYNRQYSDSNGVDYRSVMPTNLYGPEDNYHSTNSHVIPGLIRRFHEAKISSKSEVIIWGTGKPKREFLHVDDFAKAAIFLMNLSKENFYKYGHPMCSHINVGSGHELSILRLANKIKKIVGYKGKIVFDKTKPDGVEKKLLSSKIINKLGWQPKIKLEKGLTNVYDLYKKKYDLL